MSNEAGAIAAASTAGGTAGTSEGGEGANVPDLEGRRFFRLTAVDEKYSPSGARKTLNTAVQENDWEPWVLGRIGEGNAAFVAPELACFMTKAANPGFTLIIR